VNDFDQNSKGKKERVTFSSFKRQNALLHSRKMSATGANPIKAISSDIRETKSLSIKLRLLLHFYK
jgi:hypothetical protein